MQTIVNTENEKSIIPAFAKLKEIDPVSCSKVQVLISDASRSFLNAWESVFGTGVMHLVCSWHIEKNWTKQIRSKMLTEESESESLLTELKNLRRVATESEFLMRYKRMKEKWVGIRS